MPSEEELDADLDQKRQEAFQRTVRSKKIARVFVGVFLVALVIGSILFLSRYSQSLDRATVIAVVAIVSVLVGLEVVALKMNARKGKPLSEVAISAVFLILLFAALTVVV